MPYDDGSQSFTGHLWSNLKLIGATGLDLGTQAASWADGGLTDPSHLTADVAADQLAQGRGQSGATQAQRDAAEAIQDANGGASGVAGKAADKTAATVESALKWGGGFALVALLVGGSVYLFVVSAPLRGGK